MIHLLDANVLVSLAVSGHATHDAAQRWWAVRGDMTFATCPITQGALLRLLMRAGVSRAGALRALVAVADHPRHEFWPEDVGYSDVDLSRVNGHRQVTDAYLAALARRHQGSLVTFDRGLATLHPDVVTLLDP